MSQSSDHPITRSREHAFLIAAPLAIVPALTFMPTVAFLIAFPCVAHGRMIGIVVVLICALVGSFGLWQIALGAIQKPWGILNVLNVTALLVLLVIAGYTGVFLALMTLKL